MPHVSCQKMWGAKRLNWELAGSSSQAKNVPACSLPFSVYISMSGNQAMLFRSKANMPLPAVFADVAHANHLKPPAVSLQAGLAALTNIMDCTQLCAASLPKTRRARRVRRSETALPVQGQFVRIFLCHVKNLITCTRHAGFKTNCLQLLHAVW